MKTLNKKARAELKMMFGGNCAYCGVLLGEKWHADHIEAVQRKCTYRYDWEKRRTVVKFTGECWAPENDRLDNFFPACVKCNIEKSCYDVEGFRSVLERKIRVLRDNSAAFRHAERYGMVSVIKEKVVFYFETLREDAAKEQM